MWVGLVLLLGIFASQASARFHDSRDLASSPFGSISLPGIFHHPALLSTRGAFEFAQLQHAQKLAHHRQRMELFHQHRQQRWQHQQDLELQRVLGDILRLEHLATRHVDSVNSVSRRSFLEEFVSSTGSLLQRPPPARPGRSPRAPTVAAGSAAATRTAQLHQRGSQHRVSHQHRQRHALETSSKTQDHGVAAASSTQQAGPRSPSASGAQASNARDGRPGPMGQSSAQNDRARPSAETRDVPPRRQRPQAGATQPTKQQHQRQQQTSAPAAAVEPSPQQESSPQESKPAKTGFSRPEPSARRKMKQAGAKWESVLSPGKQASAQARRSRLRRHAASRAETALRSESDLFPEDEDELLL